MCRKLLNLLRHVALNVRESLKYLKALETNDKPSGTAAWHVDRLSIPKTTPL